MIPQGNRLCPVAVLPRDAEAKIAAEVRDRIEVSHFKGEETTRAFVDWIVAPTVRLVFCARPSFLRNPDTKQSLEYDIYAPEWLWALEHQGDQHFGPTKLYPGDKEFVDRFKRDLLKADLSKQHNIRLSTITKQDLTLERMIDVIPCDIPKRTFDQRGPFVQMLEQLGKSVAGRLEWDRE